MYTSRNYRTDIFNKQYSECERRSPMQLDSSLQLHGVFKLSGTSASLTLSRSPPRRSTKSHQSRISLLISSIKLSIPKAVRRILPAAIPALIEAAISTTIQRMVKTSIRMPSCTSVARIAFTGAAFTKSRTNHNQSISRAITNLLLMDAPYQHEHDDNTAKNNPIHAEDLEIMIANEMQ
jgi:hypothetical protein